jgi:hypothetical protein
MTAKVRFLYYTIINIGHNSANTAVLQMLHNSLVCNDTVEQDRQCTYNILLWHVQVMFIALWLSYQLDIISLEENPFMVI